jgi:hypothetical protein
VVVKPWLKPISIDQIVEERPFKVTIDSKKRLSVTALLAWQPDPPQASPLPEDASPASTQPTPKKKVIKKKDKVIKKENTVTEKRPISAGSAERPAAAKRLPARRRNDYFLRKAREEAPVKQEGLVKPTSDDESLPELAEILGNADNEGNAD